MMRKVPSMTDVVKSSQEALRSLALLAVGRTGADIGRLVRESRQAARRERRSMTWVDLEQALRDGYRPMSDDMRWRASVHEAGHAVAWSLLGVGEVVSATIGMREFGQVVSRIYNHVPQTETWLTRQMACMLAGRVAELIVVGDACCGAGGDDSSDLAKATDFALAAETRLGFSIHQPLIYRPTRGSFDIFSLDRELAERVHARLLSAETIARELLTENQPQLLALAERLSVHGVVDGSEVRQVLGMAVPD